MVPQTPVRPDLLESLKVITHLLVNHVGKEVGRFAVGHVFLSVDEPGGDLELGGVLHDGDDSLELVGVELTGAGSQQLVITLDKQE